MTLSDPIEALGQIQEQALGPNNKIIPKQNGFSISGSSHGLHLSGLKKSL